MKNSKKITLFFFFIFISMVSSTFAQQWSAEQKEVWASVEKYWEINNSDPIAFLKYFDGSYLGWSYDNETPGTKEDAEKSFKYRTSKGKIQFAILTPARIWVEGNFAFVHYYFTEVSENNDGTPQERKGRWTDILMKKNGSWILVGDHGGNIEK